MPRLGHWVAAPEGVDSGEEELPQLVQRCARRTGGCDNLGMALSAHGSIDLPGAPVRAGRWKWPATKMGVGGNAYYMRLTEGPLLALPGSSAYFSISGVSRPLHDCARRLSLTHSRPSAMGQVHVIFHHEFHCLDSHGIHIGRQLPQAPHAPMLTVTEGTPFGGKTFIDSPRLSRNAQKLKLR